MKTKFIVLFLATILATIGLTTATQNQVNANSIFSSELFDDFEEDGAKPSQNPAPKPQRTPNNGGVIRVPVSSSSQPQSAPNNGGVIRVPASSSSQPQSAPNNGGVIRVPASSSSQPTRNNQPVAQPTQKAATGTTQAKVACVSQGNGNYATVVRKAEGETVLISWKNRNHGSEYTPEKRCNMVTEKLQSFISANGNDIGNLLLTTGYVKGSPVICVVNEGPLGCNSTNQLLTLSGENAEDPAKTLAQFLNLAEGNISGNPIQEKKGKTVVSFNTAVDNSFGKSGSILEGGGLNIAACDPTKTSLIVFENSKVCVETKEPLKAGKRYYFNSATGKIQRQPI
ncbi:COP23 domain-containing protein [Okeania sp.]|uniref:COP23 domain-containing protein n=1 Tax=Okeania sp. TaxID=3100323 RepID=UPI002B4B28D3|nr:COP23 domain-containing protein [Okeania sp.]MEB3343672.1 COP23 domain-containing protein [Okeania sp.]